MQPVTGQTALLLRIVAVAAVIALFVAGILSLSGVTPDRVGTIGISAAVLGACLVII